MKYAFNTTLLLYLAKIIHVKQIELCATYGGNPGTYVYRVKNGTFPLDELIKICNAYHVPISWFIVPEDRLITSKEKLPNKTELIQDGDWKDIENVFGNFGAQFAKANGIGNERAANLCGISVSNFYNLFINDEKRWKKINMFNLLRILNNANVYPGEYICDPNSPIKMISGYKENGFNKSGQQDVIMNEHYYQKVVRMNNRLVNRIQTMQKEIDELRAEVAKLKEEMKE